MTDRVGFITCKCAALPGFIILRASTFPMEPPVECAITPVAVLQ